MSGNPFDPKAKRKQRVRGSLVPGYSLAVFAGVLGAGCLNTTPQEERQQDRTAEIMERDEEPEEIERREQEQRRQDYFKREQAVEQQHRETEKRVQEELEIRRLQCIEKKRLDEMQRQLDGSH
jgi:hypothetical protein